MLWNLYTDKNRKVLGEWTVTSEADINVTMDYMYMLLPVNSVYVWKQFESSEGMTDSTTIDENFNVKTLI